MEYKLGKVSTFYDSLHKTPKNYNIYGYPMVRVKDISTGFLDLSSCFNVSEDDYLEFSKKYKPQSGDIIITRVGTYGNIALVTNDKRFCLGQNTVILNVDKKMIDNKYLFYYLTSSMGQQQIESKVTGSTQKTISLKSLKEINIIRHNFYKEKQIGDLLYKIDNKINNNKQIIKNLEELSQTLFKRWFVDFEFPDENGNPYKSSGGEMIDSKLGDIPKGWEVQKINQIVNFINGHAFKSKELYKYNKNKKMYHVFKMGHIKQGGGLKSDATKSFYPKGIEKKLEKFVLKKGDILMSMTDMKNKVAILGNTALMNRDDKYIVNQRVGLLRLKEDTYIDYPFLYILTNSNEFLTTLRKKANSGVQVNLTSKAIKEQLVIVPSKNYHNKFNMITKPIYLKIFDLEIENEYLTILRDTLLPKLMSGEIEIPDDIEVNTNELSI